VFSIVPDTAACFAQVLLTDRRLQRLERHTRADLRERLTLRRAAEICGLSPTWFSNYFHVHTGMTFTVWYRRVRIERAKILLGEPDLKIEAIAYDVGYANVGTFERAFRAYTGACPKAYRETLKTLRDQTITNAYKSVRNADHAARNAETQHGSPR
jgi:transcriptional regulator GlxA family with amidase domain